MPTLPINNNQFENSFLLEACTNTSFVHLDTNGTFVDKDIDLSFNVRPATATLNATGTANISGLTFTYNSTTGNFGVTGSGNISGTATLSVTQAGWIGSGTTAAIAGSANLSNTSVAKIGLSSTTSGTAKVTPTISTQTVPSGVTNAATGSAVTTAPSSGVYIAVKTAASTATAYVVPKVSTDGYGTTQYYNTTTASLVVGANQSNTTYIQIKGGSVATPATTISQSPTMALTTASGVVSANYTKSQSVSPTVTEGWISSGTAGTITTTGSNSITLPTSTATVNNNTISIQPGWFGATTSINVANGSAKTPATTIAQSPTFALTTSSGVIVSSYTKTQSVTPTVVAGWVSEGTAGNITTTGSNSLTLPTATATISNNTMTIEPGWFGSTTALTVSSGSAVTPATTIAKAPTISLTTATGVIQAAYTSNKKFPPTVTAGWITTGTTGTVTTTGSASITLPAATAIANSDIVTISPGWYGVETAITVASGSATTPDTTIAKAPTITITTATGVVKATYNSSKKFAPTVVAGWVSTGTTGTVSTTGSATITLPAASVSVSNDTFTVTPGWIGSTTTSSVANVAVTSTNATVSGSNFTQSVLSVPTGWVSATTKTGATFANSASSGTTYLDISNTSGAPILTSGGYLYINKGYTDNVRISLAKLIPNAANVTASDQLRSGFSAYDSDGALITGNIPDKSNLDIVEEDGVFVVPSGYYATTANIALGAGDYNAGITLSAITVTPSVDISNASTYGFTTTEPSSGTYITVNPGADTPTYSATGSANITTAGYLSTGSKYAGATATVGVAAGTNYYAPVVTPTIGGNALATTTNVNTVSTTPVVTLSATGTFLSVGTANYGVTTIQPISGVDGTSFLTIDGTGVLTTTGVATGFSTVRRNTATYSNSAGVIAAHSGTKLSNSTTKSQTATVDIVPTITDNFTPLYMPIVTPSFNGGGLTINTHTNAISTTPTVTLSATGTLVTATDYGVTTTQPSSGTYKAIDVYSVATAGSIQSKFKVTRATSNFSVLAGAIAQYDNVQTLAGGSTSGTQSVNVTPTVTDNFDTLYIPVIATTFSGGTLNVSSTNAISTNMTTTSTSSYYIDAVATVTATRAQLNQYNAAGLIAAYNGVTVSNAANNNSYSTATRIYIPKATFSSTSTGGLLSQQGTDRINMSYNFSDLYNNNIKVVPRTYCSTQIVAFSVINNGYVDTNTIIDSLILNGATATYSAFYIQGVTLNKPASGEAKFSITVPNGSDDMITFVFHVDPSGNVVVDDSTDNAFS